LAGGDDLSGEWHGTYRYPGGEGPDTPFLAAITDRGGHLAGTIIEPNEFRPQTARATLEGHRFGSSVDFTKTYHGAGPEYDTPVDYVGRVLDEGTRIVGTWSVLDLDGAFEMFRDLAEEADAEQAEAVEVPVVVSRRD
jgi:hypothetical protein